MSREYTERQKCSIIWVSLYRKGFKLTMFNWIMEDKIRFFMKKLKERSDFHRVKFVILFGSQTEGGANKMSDFDFAVYFDGNDRERFDFRVSFGGRLSDNFDLQVFQDLPLYVRKEVLKGKVIYAQDMRFVYDVAYETIKEFESFKRYYYDYIRMEYIKWWARGN